MNFDPRPLWRITMQSPSGFPFYFEVRAATEAIAVDKIQSIRPSYTHLVTERRPTRV